MGIGGRKIVRMGSGWELSRLVTGAVVWGSLSGENCAAENCPDENGLGAVRVGIIRRKLTGNSLKLSIFRELLRLLLPSDILNSLFSKFLMMKEETKTMLIRSVSLTFSTFKSDSETDFFQ